MFADIIYGAPLPDCLRVEAAVVDQSAVSDEVRDDGAEGGLAAAAARGGDGNGVPLAAETRCGGGGNK